MATICFLPQRVLSQTSTVEFQSGTNIEVQSGADISANVITVNGTYSGSGTFNGGPLPVEMTAMSAVAGTRDVTLSWTTATETDNYGFEVERRMVSSFRVQVSGHETSGVIPGTETDWSKVGFVNGSGTSSSPKEYSYLDGNLAPGRYAYRIRQIDLNGSFAFTAAVEVEVGLAPLEFTLGQNYPNPFNPTTTIEFTLPEDGHVTLKIFDMAGREIATLVDKDLKAGVYHQAVFDASQLASGIYVSRLQASGKESVKKMMLVK